MIPEATILAIAEIFATEQDEAGDLSPEGEQAVEELLAEAGASGPQGYADYCMEGANRGKPGPCPKPDSLRQQRLAGSLARAKAASQKPTVDALHTKITGLSGKKLSGAQVTAVAGQMALLTHKELGQLKTRLGVKASGPKAELARKIAERALAGAKGKAAPAKKPAPAAAKKPPEPSAAPLPRSPKITEPVEPARIVERMKELDAEFTATKTRINDYSRQIADVDAELKQAYKAEPVAWRQTRKMHDRRDQLGKEQEALRGKLAEDSKQVHDELKTMIGNPQEAVFDMSRHTAKDDLTKWAFDRAQGFVNGIVSKDAGDLPYARVVNFNGTLVGGRSHYNWAGRSLNMADGDGASVFVHEYGHHLEYHLPGVQRAANDFLSKRIKGEQPQQLNNILPGNKYEDDEVGAQDDFGKTFGNQGWYVGKQYSKYSQGPTEIVSMGLQKLYEDPRNFAVADPEYFTFMMDVLKGRFNKQ